MTTEPTAIPVTDAEMFAVSDKLVAWAATLTPRECSFLITLLTAAPAGEDEVSGYMIGGSLLTPALPGIAPGAAASGSRDNTMNMLTSLARVRSDMVKGIIANFRV